MQQRSLGKQIWRIFGPLMIKAGITFLVEIVVMSIYLMPRIPDIIAEIKTQEEYFQKVMELSAELAQYGTELTAFAALLTIPILAWMFFKDRKREKQNAIAQEQTLPEQKVPLWKYLMIIGISLPFALGLNNILLLTNLTEVSEGFQQASKVLYAPSLPVQILCLGIIIPIMEELIFRGLVFKRIREESTMIHAMVFSALFFGFYHGNTVQMIYGVLSGFLLAYLYEKYQSLKAPVLAHMSMNIMVCVLSETGGFQWMFAQPLRMGVITVLCAAAASAMFVTIRDKMTASS